RRLPQRWLRLVGDDRACAATQSGVADVFARVRIARARRVAVPARARRRTEDGSLRAALQGRRHRRAFSTSDPPYRAADRALGAGGVVPAVAAGARPWLQGRAYGRRRGRSLRRLRHLQGNYGAPFLGAPAAIEVAPLASAASLSVPGRPAVAAAEVPAGVLRHGATESRRSTLLASAA